MLYAFKQIHTILICANLRAKVKLSPNSGSKAVEGVTYLHSWLPPTFR